MAAGGTKATNGISSADHEAGNGTRATTIGTRDADHADKSEGVPAAVPAGEKKESGPCGLPVKCVIL